MVYGTTIPFNFRLDGVAGRMSRINWHPLGLNHGNVSVGDLLQNILLFIPFGFLGFISIARKESRLPLKIGILVLMGASLSAFVEFLQLYSLTRWTAVSDVLFNSLGTALGAAAGVLLKSWVYGIKTTPRFRRLMDAPSAFPALVFAGLAAGGAWEPFDFALEMGAVLGKGGAILRDPFDLSWPDDELATFIRFLLASLFACRLAAEAGTARPARAMVPILVLAAVGLEATQIIILSRAPTFQDAVTASLGVAAGGIAFGFPGFREHPWKWGAVGALAVAASAAMAGLHPFRFQEAYSGFNWTPFLAEYADTKLGALGNFAETALAFFPLGFLLGYFFPASRRSSLLSLGLAVALSAWVEGLQGLVVGRHGDITDVFAAAMGSLAGSLTLRRGWRAYREYVAADPASREGAAMGAAAGPEPVPGP